MPRWPTPVAAAPALMQGGWPVPRHLPVGGVVRMAWRELGPAHGPAWLLLHGGPGSGSQPGQVAPFASGQRLVLPDQRGAGASRPRGGLWGNHTAALVSDLERLRRHLGLERWSVLGGSWGTVLALVYASRHPDRVERVVLRGAFGLRRKEVEGLLRPRPHRLQRLGPAAGHWPQVPWASAPVRQARLEQLLQSATPGVAGWQVCRTWQWLENELACKGLWRSLLHAAGGQGSGLRASWAVVHRQQRRVLARLQRVQPGRGDRALWRKFRVQAHYLRHQGFVRPGRLDAAVVGLARAGVPVHWVHGVFDAVCPLANSRHWAHMGRRQGGPVGWWPAHGGHLASEPGVLQALREAVAWG